jgi:hypothetical protein
MDRRTFIWGVAVAPVLLAPGFTSLDAPLEPVPREACSFGSVDPLPFNAPSAQLFALLEEIKCQVYDVTGVPSEYLRC